MIIIVIFIIFLFHLIPSSSDEIEFSEAPTVTTLNIHESKTPVKKVAKPTKKKKYKNKKGGKKKRYKAKPKRKPYKTPYKKRAGRK